MEKRVKKEPFLAVYHIDKTTEELQYAKKFIVNVLTINARYIRLPINNYWYLVFILFS